MGLSPRETFFQAVQRVLERCPGCGGDGMCRDDELIVAGVDYFNAYIPCGLCGDIRDGLEMARERSDDDRG
jgi:hypothetical protein